MADISQAQETLGRIESICLCQEAVLSKELLKIFSLRRLLFRLFLSKPNENFLSRPFLSVVYARRLVIV